MSLPLSAFAGNTVYLDTMLPYILLRGIAPAVKPFFQRIEDGNMLAYTSALTFDELAYRLLGENYGLASASAGAGAASSRGGA